METNRYAPSIGRIAAEAVEKRLRQIYVHGYTAEHDDRINQAGELFSAAVAYALVARGVSCEVPGSITSGEIHYPWRKENLPKEKDPREMAITAIAFLIAAVEQIDRLFEDPEDAFVPAHEAAQRVINKADRIAHLTNDAPHHVAQSIRYVISWDGGQTYRGNLPSREKATEIAMQVSDGEEFHIGVLIYPNSLKYSTGEEIPASAVHDPVKHAGAVESAGKHPEGTQ